MADTNTNVDTTAPTELDADNGAFLRKLREMGNDASLLKLLEKMGKDAFFLKLLEKMESSEKDPNDPEIYREWIASTDDDDRTLLHFAATEGLAKAAKKLIDSKAELTARDRWGDTPLIDACREGHKHVVELFLGKVPETDNISGGENESPFFTAAINGHSQVVQCLLAVFKGNINDKEEQYDMTLLHASSQVGDYKSVRLLRDKGARLDVRDVDGWTPLMTATVYKEKDAMTELLRMQDNENPQLETRDLKGQTPILRAAEDGFWRGVRCLAEASVEYYSDLPKAPKPTETDPTSTDFPKENTALHCAIKKGRSSMVQFLLDKGFDVNAQDHQGRQPLHLASQRGDKDILEILLKKTKCNHIDNGDDEGWTPLHFASEGGDRGSHGQNTPQPEAKCQTDEETSSSESESESEFESEFNSKSKSGQYDEVVKVLLEKGADTEAKTKKNDKMAMELAFDNDHVDRARLIFDAFATLHDKGTKTLIWAAGKTERHWIAALLFKRQQKEPSEASIAKKSESWTAIEWAAYASEPKVLWLLIANSPQSGETKRTIKRALKRAKAAVEEPGQKNGTKKGNSWQEIQRILRNPPTGLLCGDSSTKMQPRCQDGDSCDEYHATIVQFYNTQGKFDSIIWSQTVRETIDRDGLTEKMEEVVKGLKEQGREYLKELGEKAMPTVEATPTVPRHGPIFMDSEAKPKFTRIHLPATNMDWIDDLRQRIMVDEYHQYESHIGQVKSFFKDSWTEVPDKTSDSRMMRPRFVSRDTKISGVEMKDVEKGDSSGREETVKQEQRELQNGEARIAATAIYMPYLSYCFQCIPEQEDKRSLRTDEPTNKPPPVGLEDRRVRHKKESDNRTTSEQEAKRTYTKTLFKARQKYKKLLKEYKKSIVHRSSTLDESYYHFGIDPASVKDKEDRNKSQVATKSWQEDQQQAQKQGYIEKLAQGEEGQTPKKQDPGPYWPLIRVNQLWMWTIDDKWLISASSHPIDDGEDELLDGILDHLEKQREAAGSDSQPGSVAEMSRLIVDYCVDNYERKPQAPEGERPKDCDLTKLSSIRQVFSKSINSIARDESNLSERFDRVTKEMHENAGEHRRDVEKLDKDLAIKVTSEAKELSMGVKDILDELKMLETIAEYQQDVQKAMRRYYAPEANGKQNILETEYTATYVIEDIKRMCSTAERVHAAVNTTLSLHQSEIANIQAQESLYQSHLSSQQGTIVMAFTVVTILFLPLSFLTSFFALDVASFEQAPPWAIGVIFSVSVAFCIPTVIIAFTWKKSKKFMSDTASVLGLVKTWKKSKKFMSFLASVLGLVKLWRLMSDLASTLWEGLVRLSETTIQRGRSFIRYSLGFTEAVKPQGDDCGYKPGPKHGTSQQSTSTTNSAQARNNASKLRVDSSMLDLESGRSNER